MHFVDVFRCAAKTSISMGGFGPHVAPTEFRNALRNEAEPTLSRAGNTAGDECDPKTVRRLKAAHQTKKEGGTIATLLSSHLKKKCITASTKPRIALTRPKITVTKRILSEFIWKVLSKALPKSSTPPQIISGRGTLGDVCNEI